MCRLRNIALRDFQESVTTGQTDTHRDGQTDAGQSDPYVPLCFASDTKMEFLYSIEVCMETHMLSHYSMKYLLYIICKVKDITS